MKIRRKMRHANPGTFRTICLIVASLLLLTVISSCVALVINVNRLNEELPDVTNSSLFNFAEKSRIYAADGETVLAELQLENRQPVQSLNEISPYVIKGTIATEDARYYNHKGVDIWGLLRAATKVLSGGQTQGGSTITMQLMRNTILSKQAQTISLERKLAEIILASKMEEIYSKEEILLMYLNTINYGDGCYGIKAAAEHYFSKAPIELTLSEAATLVGIPQSPTYLAPTSNIKASTNRRSDVLGRMYSEHFITAEEMTAAENEPIVLNITNKDISAHYKYPYFTTYVRDLLMERYTTAEIFEGGMQVYTTLDVKHQEANEAGCASQNNKIEKDAECAAVTIDPTNGFITSMVGGADFEENQFNIAAQKGRPTGSSFKTFTLLTAISQGYNPQKVSVDCSNPLEMNGSKIYNFGKTNYGYKTIQDAVAVSSNTGLVRLQDKVGTDKVIDMARKVGIKDAKLPEVATLSLGVADITPLEMASAYATICSGGIYHEPIAIQKIEDSKGEVLYEFDSETEGKGDRVISKEVAGAATKVLKKVFTSGTATSAQLNNGQPVAGKTGTSEDYRDHTLVGYTPRLVLATWIGKRNYTPTSSWVSCNTLFKNIMSTICQDEPIQEFEEVKDPDYKNVTNLNSQNNQYDGQNKDVYNAPNVIGMDEASARSALAAYPITVYRASSKTVAKGIVMSQSVSNGRIILYISTGL